MFRAENHHDINETPARDDEQERSRFFASNLLDYALTDVLCSLAALLLILLFLASGRRARHGRRRVQNAGQGWIPWVVVSAVVIAWTHLKVFVYGQRLIPWPGLHNQVFISLYGKPYAATWAFQPLASGTAILLSAIITAALVEVGPARFAHAVAITWRLPLVSALLGWVAVFLSGSDTSGNALFGTLQVVVAHQLGLNPVLIAAIIPPAA